MAKFEYKTVLINVMSLYGKRIDTARMDKELNKLGAEGWELVASKSSQPGWGNDKGIVCVFKRCMVIQELKKHIKLSGVFRDHWN
ncbi:MAG: DUF4177 domain-containing protein [Firmicutes bacterium]|nr:DUF4177 domain-containing protein [Bacillota bacterium]